ncbi:MAG TPA: FeoB small GTPase domain-containing protein, partial [Candidatus Hydrogenedentes bacterium]|nr:FeoB small GTPase domain-containing protein [Candidatus Hydrogenedentota bacterium]
MNTGEIVIAGNPNAGKTSVYNRLTGAVQQVSNYPGVTVEFVCAQMRHGGQSYTVVDLPGTYSLTAYSQEELVARNYIVERKPALIVNVVDASNFERNLYLTSQLAEMRVPLL